MGAFGATASSALDITHAAQALILERGADCYSVNVEQDGCQILLKRRVNKSNYQTVGRIRATHDQRPTIESALRVALGWDKENRSNEARASNLADQIHVGDSNVDTGRRS